MKLLNNYKLFFVLITAFYNSIVLAEEPKPKLLVDVVYHLNNNTFPFVSIFTKSKIEKKFIAVPNISVKVYLGQEADANLLGLVITNKYGKGMISFPVSVKTLWDTLSQFKLIGTSVAGKQYESVSNEVSLTKAKIYIDTLWADGVRSIAVTVKVKSGNEWKPVKDVETKIIMKRSVGNLSIGDKETYTTDSTGKATAEFTKSAMPGDTAGNIIIVGKTEDNELYGNISLERRVKWGVPLVNVNTFDRRTLFATSDKAPLWLLFLAVSIFITVWAVIIYLVLQIIKIRKAGMENRPDIA